MRSPLAAGTLYGIAATLSFGLSSFASAAENAAPANSILMLEESFERDTLGSGWITAAGNWTVRDGVLRASEIPADNHIAVARRLLQTDNAVYQLKFRLVDEVRAFHIGFDPVRSQSPKGGHLFSVVVTPKSWSIRKHVDTNRPKKSPAESLVSENTSFHRGRWYTLRVTTWGKYVTAAVDGKPPLKASHPTFAVAKPTLILRCLGDGVEIDHVRVWRPLPKS